MRLPFLGEPDSGKEGVVGWLEEVYRACDTARRQYEPEWVDNIHMLEGRHWEKAAEDIRRGRKLPVWAPSTRVQATANWIYSLARQAAAGIRDNLGEQRATAATFEQEDVEAAEIGTDFLSFRMEQDREEELRFHDILWTMVCGQALRFTAWDPEADAVGYVEALRQPVKLPGSGDIRTLTLNPWRYHLPPWCERANEAEFIIVSDVRDVEEIDDLYGATVEPEEVAAGIDMVQGLANAALQGAGSGGTGRRKHAAILKRMYVAPTPRQPKGLLYVWAHGVQLQKAALPDGVMPFVALEWFNIPGRLYPLAFVTPLRDPNRQYNITLSQLIELKNRQLRGDVVVHGAVNEEDVTQDVDPETGWKRIRVAPHVQGFELMNYNLPITGAELLMARFWSDGQQLAGIRDPSLGQAPAGVTTATGLSLLKESDVQGLSLFRWGFDRAYGRVASQKLLLAQQHYDVPRLLRVVGENDRPKVRSFTGADLRNTEDVQTRPRPVLSEAQKSMVRMDLVTRGIYGPYTGPGHKFAMMTALLYSGLPNVREEVDSLCAPMSYEELGRLAGAVDAMMAHGQMLQLQALLQQAAAPQLGPGPGLLGAGGPPPATATGVI